MYLSRFSNSYDPNSIFYWNVGDNPSELINFIKEIMNDFRQYFSSDSPWTDEETTKICQKYSDVNFFYHRGKGISFTHHNAYVCFQHFEMDYVFIFNYIQINISEDYYDIKSNSIQNLFGLEDRFVSNVEGLEDLKTIEGFSANPLTINISILFDGVDEHDGDEMPF